MKRKKTYGKELKDMVEIMKMMEDVFGHRVTSYSPKDTSKLKRKLSKPTTDSEKEKYVDEIEPLMNKKSFVPKGKDKNLDSFLDIDNRTYASDFDPTIDLDDYKKSTKIVFKKKEEPEKKTDDSENKNK